MERLHLLLAVLLALLGSGTIVHAKSVSPNEDSDPVTELEQLRTTLQDLNQQIDTYVESEKQVSSDAARKRRTLDLQERTVPEQDQTLQDYINSLSPEDKQLLQHMKSKAKYLQGVLHESEHEPNPGESLPQVGKKDEIPGLADDPDLQQFAGQLSAEDLLLLKKLGSKVKYLQNELHDGPHVPNPGEQAAVKKSHIPSTDDRELQEFAQQLSPEDQLILEKLQGRLKYLQNALHEGKHLPNPGEGASEPDKRTVEDPDTGDHSLEEFLASLSPEDAELIKGNEHKMELLKSALEEPADVANPGESAREKRTKAKDTAADPNAENEVNKQPPQEAIATEDVEFTAADRILLKAVAKKLEELRLSLEAFKDAQGEPDELQAPAGPNVAVLVPAHLLTAGQTAGETAGTDNNDELEDTMDETEMEPTKKIQEKRCIGKKCTDEKKRCEECGGQQDKAEQKETVTRRKLIGNRTVSRKSVNLGQVLRALRKMKSDGGTNEANGPATDQQIELDNLGIR